MKNKKLSISKSKTERQIDQVVKMEDEDYIHAESAGNSVISGSDSGFNIKTQR